MRKKNYVMFLSLANFINVFSMGAGGGSSSQGNYGYNYGNTGTTGQGSKGGIFGSSATGAELSSQGLYNQSSTYDTKAGMLETKQQENEGKVELAALTGLGVRHYVKGNAAKKMEEMKATHEKEMQGKQKELDEIKKSENELSERGSKRNTEKGKNSKRAFEEEDLE